MSRQRLQVGEHGTITTSRTSDDAWTARTNHRGLDGVVRPRQATRQTKTIAVRDLREMFTAESASAGERLTGDSSINDLATAWLTNLRVRDEVGTETYDYYRRAIRTLIVPSLGATRVSELRPVAIRQFYNRLLTSATPDGGTLRTPSRPQWAHSVLTQMLQYAVEIGVLDENPTRDIRPSRQRPREVRVLNLELFHHVRAAVATYDERPEVGPRRSHQLLDIFDLLAATGARIGEVLALRWTDIDLNANPVTVSISGTLLPPRNGEPIRRKEGTKTPASMRRVTVPPFAAATLRRLHERASTDDLNAPVFPNRNGTWLSPNNIRREWRDCRAGHKWDWVTPHAFRKTVATLIDDHYSNTATGGTEGAGAAVAAAVLGHSTETITRAFYIKKMRSAPDVSGVLQCPIRRLPE